MLLNLHPCRPVLLLSVFSFPTNNELLCFLIFFCVFLVCLCVLHLRTTTATSSIYPFPLITSHAQSLPLLTHLKSVSFFTGCPGLDWQSACPSGTNPLCLRKLSTAFTMMATPSLTLFLRLIFHRSVMMLIRPTGKLSGGGRLGLPTARLGMIQI